MRVGVIHNRKSYRNRQAGGAPALPPDVLSAMPDKAEELSAILRGFADQGVEILVIDGGDGTVRDVLRRAHEIFAGRLLRLVVIPSGKTNALALDLGARPGWSLETALASSRTAERAPIEVFRDNPAKPAHRGFVFGAGAFVTATEAAGRAHKLRLIDSLAVGVVLTGAAGRALFGSADDPWRAGVPMIVRRDDGEAREAARFLLLATTLQRLPLNLKPFGPPRPGMKVLEVAAPPRRLAAAIPPILKGREPAWLEAAGYRRFEADTVRLSMERKFVLDGEAYAGGELTLKRGAPLTFIVPDA